MGAIVEASQIVHSAAASDGKTGKEGKICKKQAVAPRRAVVKAALDTMVQGLAADGAAGKIPSPAFRTSPANLPKKKKLGDNTIKKKHILKKARSIDTTWLSKPILKASMTKATGDNERAYIVGMTNLQDKA